MIATQQVVLARDRFDLYCWRSELDLMTRLAGLAPVERWSDWERRPFTSSSHRHISLHWAGG